MVSLRSGHSPVMTVSKELTEAQIRDAAAKYGVEYAALRAVLEVESSGDGFLTDGQLKILFERHWLYRRLSVPGRGIDPGPLAKAHPELCGRSWNPKQYPYGPTSLQWKKVSTIVQWAQKCDPDRVESYRKAALESCSFGLAQMMGFHYEACGYPSVDAFRDAMQESEANQLQAMLRWMKGNGLLDKLRVRNWIAFATGYNGIANVIVYSGRLRAAYKRFA
jgi:hypothetical protein